MSKMVIIIAFLAGCATATSNREELAINRFFDDRVSAETDAVLIKYIEKHRALALDLLAKATNANVRHGLALHIMRTTPSSIDEMRTLISERRRCHQLQTRLQEDKENLHEIVRTLSIAGCSQHIK
ncbi:MAG: hypothetical protein ACRDGM_05070 [bacterium]